MIRIADVSKILLLQTVSWVLSEFIEEGCKCNTSGACDSTKDMKQGLCEFRKEKETLIDGDWMD